MGRIEVGRLAGVDDRAAADRDEAVEIALAGKMRRRQEGPVGRLDPDLVVEHHVDAGIGQGFAGDRHVLEAAEHLVGHQRDALDAARAGVIAELAQHPGPEGDRRDIDREGVVAARARRVIMTASHGGYLTGAQRGDKARDIVPVRNFAETPPGTSAFQRVIFALHPTADLGAGSLVQPLLT